MDKQIADPKEDGKTERWRDIIGNGQRTTWKDKGREKGREKREQRNRKEIR